MTAPILDKPKQTRVRASKAELLAELGCSQYGIMAILGHSEAKTSEVYTRRAERWKLAFAGLEKVANSAVWRWVSMENESEL